MTGTHYDQGRRFEWKVRDDLASRGFTVLRMAGSKGEAKVDLVAVRPGRHPHPGSDIIQHCSCHSEHLWIQCKRTGNLPPAEWNQLRYWAAFANTTPILAENGKNGRGVTYYELTGTNVPYSRVKPMELYVVRDYDTMPV